VTDQGDELALRDVEVDVAQGDEGAFLGVESHLHVFDLDIFFHDFLLLQVRREGLGVRRKTGAVRVLNFRLTPHLTRN
jgi:hypothetical protein